jgi:hypothetical protein
LGLSQAIRAGRAEEMIAVSPSPVAMPEPVST